jgi:hypothetical protein
LLFAQQILKNDTLRAVLLVRIALNLSARSFSTEYAQSRQIEKAPNRLEVALSSHMGRYFIVTSAEIEFD